jgi:hypothetical protein
VNGWSHVDKHTRNSWKQRGSPREKQAAPGPIHAWRSIATRLQSHRRAGLRRLRGAQWRSALDWGAPSYSSRRPTLSAVGGSELERCGAVSPTWEAHGSMLRAANEASAAFARRRSLDAEPELPRSENARHAGARARRYGLVGLGAIARCGRTCADKECGANQSRQTAHRRRVPWPSPLIAPILVQHRSKEV